MCAAVQEGLPLHGAMRKNREEEKDTRKEPRKMNKISRKGFLKIAAAAAMSGVTAGALAACNAASSSKIGRAHV